MTFEIYLGKDGLWRWRLKAANREIIAQGEGYRNASDCVHVIRLVQQSAGAKITQLVA